MKNVKIKSVFEQIAAEVFTMRDVNKAKVFIIEFITSKGINGIDKNVIVNNVNKCTNINSIQRYVCNSLLQYEGMSVN
jgi:DNA polymerase sigma